MQGHHVDQSSNMGRKNNTPKGKLYLGEGACNKDRSRNMTKITQNMVDKWQKEGEELAAVSQFPHECSGCKAKYPADALLKLGTCCRCYSSLYCNKHCQKKDWPLHQQICCELAGAKMQEAIAKNDLDLLSKLVVTERNVNALVTLRVVGCDGEPCDMCVSPIFECVYENNLDALKLLLDTGHVDLELTYKVKDDTVTKTGATCLFFASACRDQDNGALMKLLIEYGANPNATSEDGCSCLGIAASLLNFTNAKCLLDGGATDVVEVIFALKSYFCDASQHDCEKAALMIELLEQYTKSKEDSGII
jgi:hypothetical protein